MRQIYEIAPKDEMDLIHEKSLDLLETTGVAFSCEEALEIFKKHGCKVDGETVFIPRELVAKAMSTVPAKFDWYGRNGNFVTVGGGETVHTPAYGPMFVLDQDQYRFPTCKDFADFCKLDETSDVISTGNANILDQPEVPLAERGKYISAATLLYLTKPIMGDVDGKERSLNAIKMTKEFYDVTDDRCFLSGLIDVASPLHYTQAMAEGLIEYAKAGQAVVITGTSISGLTVPDTMASGLLVVNTENLAGIVLSQLVNPGTPVVYGNQGHGSDLRHSSLSIGSPEDSLFYHVTKSFGMYYNMPVRCGGSLTDSKYVDMQAGFESFNSAYATIHAGTDHMIHTCGILDTFNSVSYEKYMIDEENIKQIKRFIRGIHVDEKALMIEKIKKAGPMGNFIARTSKEYKENYNLPKLPIRINHGQWIDANKPSIIDNAHAAKEKRLEEYTLQPLEAFQKKIIESTLSKEHIFAEI